MRDHSGETLQTEPMTKSDGTTIKNHAAFLIGVADAGTVHGLDSDYATLHKEGRGDRDVFQLHLANVIGTSMGDAAGTAVSPLSRRTRPVPGSRRTIGCPRGGQKDSSGSG